MAEVHTLGLVQQPAAVSGRGQTAALPRISSTSATPGHNTALCCMQPQISIGTILAATVKSTTFVNRTYVQVIHFKSVKRIQKVQIFNARYM